MKDGVREDGIQEEVHSAPKVRQLLTTLGTRHLLVPASPSNYLSIVVVVMAGARSSNCPLRVEYGSLTEELGQAFKIFKKYVKVHDLYFVATEKCPDEKILHGAWVLHQYIDNDGDGKPDNPLVYQKLVENKATMVMFEDEDHMERHIEKLHRRNERDKDVLIQDLQADETQPGSLEPDCFDASLEECFHLVTMGYIIAYPEVFGHHRLVFC